MARSAKTDKVMSLFGEKSEILNPVMAHSNPIINPPEEEAVPPVFVKSAGGLQLVNVVFLLINEQLGGIMERFNCCMCEKCIFTVTKEVLSVIPPLILEVRRKSDEKAVNKAASEIRSDVVKAITKAVISIKTNPPHYGGQGSFSVDK